jgi:acetyl/propionyl-CoA carboxylase alpha subunit
MVYRRSDEAFGLPVEQIAHMLVQAGQRDPSLLGRSQGLASVAVYSDADADAPHVAEADEAVRIGPPPSRESYLAIDRILAAAAQVGADAIHPGYGFLAENADFAEAVAAARLTWIGPPADALRAGGDQLVQRTGAEFSYSHQS